MMKPNKLNVIEVKTRKISIQNGCIISSGTKNPDVIRIINPTKIDLVAAAPT